MMMGILNATTEVTAGQSAGDGRLTSYFWTLAYHRPTSTAFHFASAGCSSPNQPTMVLKVVAFVSIVASISDAQIITFTDVRRTQDLSTGFTDKPVQLNFPL
jgi:hypothetical protein